MKKKSAKPSAPLSLRKPFLHSQMSALTVGIPSLLLGGMAIAADKPTELDTLRVDERRVDSNPYAQAGAPYKAKISGDRRHVKELAATPQTVNVLTQTMLQESGKSDLRDILAAQPGITLGTGENGNAFGDRYVIRGHEARSDVFVDGLRDPGMTTRESFAVEQIEITKGPSATFAGRGSSGGAVNSVTKQASTDYDFTKAQGGLGTDNYQRYTLDVNKRINDKAALRANVLFADEDVPDRAPASRERQGLALSGAFQITDKLSVIADYYYRNAEDKPDLGTYIDRTTGKPKEDIPVYLQDEDFLESETNTATLRMAYQVNDTVRLENALRFGTTDNAYIVTGAGGTTRDVSDPVAPGADTITLSTHQGWQEVEYFVDQLNVYIDTSFGGMTHNILVGAEYSTLSVLNGNYSISNTGDTNCIVGGRRGVSSSYCATDANGSTVANIQGLLGRSIVKGDSDTDYNVDTVSVSLMDTVQITDQLSVFLGLRLDDFDYSNKVLGRGQTSATDWAYSDTLWNGHAGVVYQLTDNGNIYLTYSTASNINGGESDVGSNCGYGGLCGAVEIIDDSEPEDVENIELGTKWNILNEKLLATAAIFQITKDNIMESERGFDYATNGFLNTGKNRVDGVEVSVVGNINDELSIQFGASIMNARIKDSYTEGNIGHTLANFADKSAYLQLRYQLNPKLSVGTTVTYSSEVFSGQPDTAAGDIKVPAYTVVDLFGSYAITDKLDLRLNVANVTDEDYYFTAYRSGSFTYLGDARHAELTVTYEF